MGHNEDQHPAKHAIDDRGPVDESREDSVVKALDFLLEGELKLLAIYDARQASADARTTALATAAIALPPLILSLSKAFTSNAMLPHVGYMAVVIVAIGILIVRGWNAWRARRPTKTESKPGWLHVSAEGAAVADARKKWRDYQETTHVGQADQVRVDNWGWRCGGPALTTRGESRRSRTSCRSQLPFSWSSRS